MIIPQLVDAMMEEGRAESSALRPMEPRAAVAEWQNGRLTVWTGTCNPASVRQQLAETFGVAQEQVRVLVPRFGGGFGGKHTAEAARQPDRCD
jgi:isoquinoline 1-oxidoreductase